MHNFLSCLNRRQCIFNGKLLEKRLATGFYCGFVRTYDLFRILLPDAGYEFGIVSKNLVSCFLGLRLCCLLSKFKLPICDEIYTIDDGFPLDIDMLASIER